MIDEDLYERVSATNVRNRQITAALELKGALATGPESALELYNLATDPLELLECSRTYPDRVTAMTLAFQKAYAAVLADPLRPQPRNP